MDSGWGTYAYALATGVNAGLAVVFLMVGLNRRARAPLMVAFGAWAATSGMQSAATVWVLSSDGVAQYSDRFELFGLILLLNAFVGVVLVAQWTSGLSQRVMRWFGLGTALIGLAYIVSPTGLLIGEVDDLRSVSLFGERFQIHVAEPSRWRPVITVYMALFAALIIVASVRAYRRGTRRTALGILAGFAVVVAGAAYDDAVELGRVGTTYIGPFCTLGVTIAGAMVLTHRRGVDQARLRDHAVELEAIVGERTAQLVDLNHRLERQLEIQRRITGDLRSLTEQFERSNEMVEPTSQEVAVTLHSLLGQLGEIVAADAVELRIDDRQLPGILPPTTSWHRAPSDRAGADGEILEPIRLGGAQVGLLAITTTSATTSGLEASQFVELVAEHLAGLVQRLELTARIADSATESERRRIAMELHDSVTQRMYSVSFLADAAVHLAGEQPHEVAPAVERIRQMVLSSLAELRALLVELRPHGLDDEPIPDLIERLVDGMRPATDAQITWVGAPTPEFAPDVKVGLYRIVQEALSNACRHSAAEHISVRIEQRQEGTTLLIADDGGGFDAEHVAGHGIDNLRARASAIGASLEIVSNLGGGTTVRVDMPHRSSSIPERSTVPT